MKTNKWTLFTLLCLIAVSCNDNDTPGTVPGQGTPPGSGGPVNNSWIIPENEVFDGGPGKDGIPAIDNPQFLNIENIDFLNEDDLVIGFKSGDDVRAYPHPILDWHEIVNDNVGGTRLAVVYCPLTGTATGWNRVLPVRGETTFGVSGLLFNTNIIPYDRITDSNWSQMRLECVQGALRGDTPEVFHVVETTWRSWKEMYPNSVILSTNTGFSRNYGRYPYGDYRTNDSRLLFPVANSDDRLPGKDRVLGIKINTSTKVYPVEVFGNGIGVYEDNVGGTNLVIAGSNSRNFAVAFDRELDGAMLSFTPVQDEGNIIMEDQNGSRYDIFGYAVSGPNEGKRLTTTEAYIGYYFAWVAFNPDLEIFTP